MNGGAARGIKDGQRITETAVARGRQQWESTESRERLRLLNERLTAVAIQLGDENPATRLVSVHAMAGLADDWPENRQTCLDVPCAYLQMPYETYPGDQAPAEERLDFRASQQVRHAVIRVVTAHLRDGATTSWRGLDFDLRRPWPCPVCSLISSTPAYAWLYRTIHRLNSVSGSSRGSR